MTIGFALFSEAPLRGRRRAAAAATTTSLISITNCDCPSATNCSCPLRLNQHHQTTSTSIRSSVGDRTTTCHHHWAANNNPADKQATMGQRKRARISASSAASALAASIDDHDDEQHQGNNEIMMMTNKNATTTTTTTTTTTSTITHRNNNNNDHAHNLVSKNCPHRSKGGSHATVVAHDAESVSTYLGGRRRRSRHHHHHHHWSPLFAGQLALVVCLLALIKQAGEAVAATGGALVAPSFGPSYAPISPPSGGPSLCPLVQVCICKWSTAGKQSASCENRQLTSIPAQLPHDTQVLEMNHNNLIQLSAHIFQDKQLTNLQRLYLSDCKISFIADEAFAHLTNLVELDLSQNRLQQIPVQSFERLDHSKLRKLSLAHNQLQTIEPNTFTSLSQLNILDLNGNQLSQLKAGAFHGLGQLTELRLQDNRLSQLPMNVMVDLNQNYLTLDLLGNHWHCDCELRESIDWMARHHHQQNMVPTCATPERIKDLRWHTVKPDDFLCPPVVVNKFPRAEIVVGAGSNVSFYCSVRGTPPFTFVWYQDEKSHPLLASGASGGAATAAAASPANGWRSNLTSNDNLPGDKPTSTKLLEEKRYEIVNEFGPMPGTDGGANYTTSILYLFDLKLIDTSMFLCWVENDANFTIANFSLVVTNDSPPAHLDGGFSSSSSPLSPAPGTGSSLLRSFGLSQSEAQVAIVSLGFLLVLVAAIVVLLLMFNHGSSKSSQSSDLKQSGGNQASGGGISAANKFGQANSMANHYRSSMLAESEDDDDDDAGTDSSSASSCRKNPKAMTTGGGGSDLGGFIEHMRSGIINMDYHSMSPVIQFNNTGTLGKGTIANQEQQQHRQQQQQQLVSQKPMPYLECNPNQVAPQPPMHHFQSASNASSVPYYGNGSASMATTTSDLSPSSGGSVSVGSNTNFANNGPNLTNCDHQLQHQLTTNTTATGYTSDYQSEEQASMVAAHHNNMMPPMYYEHAGGYHPGAVSYTSAPGHPLGPHVNHAGGGALIVGPANSGTLGRPNSMIVGPHHHLSQHQQQQHQQQQHHMMQDMMHGGRLVSNSNNSNSQRQLHLDAGFHIL